MQNNDLSQILEYLKTNRRQGETDIYLAVPATLATALMLNNGSELLHLLCRAGYEPYAHYTYDAGYLRITNLLPCRDPCYSVQTETEYKTALQKAGETGQQQFRIFLPDSLLDRLMQENKRQLIKLEGEAGVISSKMTCYAEAGMVQYLSLNLFGKMRREPEVVRSTPLKQTPPAKEASTRKTAANASRHSASPGKNSSKPGSPGQRNENNVMEPILASMHDVKDWIVRRASQLDNRITFYCPPNMIRSFMDGIPNNAGSPLQRINDLCNSAGIFKYTWNYQEIRGKVTINIQRYYPGFRIIRARQMNKTNILDHKEQQTLAAAQRLLEGIHETQPADKALAISRAIGLRTVYTIDETTDEDDCAIGPLVNGKANCDGYADAFYLCATLAGLTVGYQFGCSNLPEPLSGSFRAQTHLWNRIYLNRQWTMLDATWDHNDAGSALNYTYFMIGNDRAKQCYRWNRDMYPDLQETTDPHRASPVLEFRCSTKKDVMKVFRDMKKKKAASFLIFPEQAGILDSVEDIKYYLTKAGFFGQFSYNELRHFGAWRIVIQK